MSLVDYLVGPSLSTFCRFQKQLSTASLPFVHFSDTKEVFHIHSCVVPFPLCKGHCALSLPHHTKKEFGPLTGGTRTQEQTALASGPSYCFPFPCPPALTWGHWGLRRSGSLVYFPQVDQILDLKLKKIKKHLKGPYLLISGKLFNLPFI